MQAGTAPAEIALANVTRRFGNSVAVQDLSFEVGTSEIVALLGRTGAGKSTAMNLIMGNLKATSGTVRVAGFDPYEEFDRLRGTLAVSFQTDRLLPWRTAVENIELGLQILRVDKADGRRRASEWLDPRQDGRRGRQVSARTVGRHAPARVACARARGRPENPAAR